MSLKLSKPSNKELATLAKEMSRMSRGERASKYLELSDRGVDETISGFLAFAGDASKSLHLSLADDLEDKAAEMSPASREATLDLVSRLRMSNQTKPRGG